MGTMNVSVLGSMFGKSVTGIKISNSQKKKKKSVTFLKHSIYISFVMG